MAARIALIISLAVVLALGGAWLRAHARTYELRAAVDKAVGNASPEHRSAALPVVSTPDPMAENASEAELSARAALLEEAKRIPEVARREAALRVILALKEKHAASEPTPKPLPFVMPKNAPYFVELLDDPEYVSLQLEQWREVSGRMSEQRLQRIGVPAEMRAQIVDLEFDMFANQMESSRFAGTQSVEHQAALHAASEARQENQEKLRALLGEEVYARYSSFEGRLTARAENEFRRLATRLSYSATPLNQDDFAALQAELDALPPPKSSEELRANATRLDARVRNVLRPEQIVALDELKAEEEAAAQRRKLPKSSELPRTTRRARLEGNTTTP